MRFPSALGWNRQTGRVDVDKGCLFIEQLLKKQKTQTFLVTNVKSFPDEVCSQEKSKLHLSPQGGHTAGQCWGPRAPLCSAMLRGAAFLCPHVPSASATSYTTLKHRIYRPQIPTSRHSLCPTHGPGALKGRNKTTKHPTQTERRLQRNTKVCTAIKR